MTDIGRNLAEVRDRIAEAALRSGRDPERVTLVAVTKTHPVDMVVEAFQAGARDFGENRVEEGASKIPVCRDALKGGRPTWHMIGHVQSRKARAVVSLFDTVHSVDGVKLAKRLSRFAEEAGRTIPVLLECNVSGEGAKYGFNVGDWAGAGERRSAFVDIVREIVGLPALSVRGLMTMAPLVHDPESVRPVFARLRALLDFCRARFPHQDWDELSMGMTDDFEVAVEEGATMVRVGRAIFGDRG